MSDKNKKKSAVLFLAWGEKYISEVQDCVLKSKPITKYDLVLITDQHSSVTHLDSTFTHIIRADFQTKGLLRKTEMVDYLPDQYETFLFLDSDTVVIEDVSLGFEKARKHGIAVSPAPHYSLDYFSEFSNVMTSENVGLKGQLQYNTGVIFFANSPTVKNVFNKWRSLASHYRNDCGNDQPFFSLAMELLDVNPYTLSISYNYRGFGDPISGVVRVWHSHGKMPLDINVFEKAWPPRKAWPNKVSDPSSKGIYSKVKRKLGKYLS